MIGSVQFIGLPLTFLASAVEAGRAALSTDVDWGYVVARLGWLTVVAMVLGWLATGAFRAYQKTA